MQTQNYIYIPNMNLASVYNSFVYGKFVTETDSGYRLVARSTDLTNEEHLGTMVETYRFWGSRPPEKNAEAIGIFLEEGNKNLVLVKVETAVDESKIEATSGGRTFRQRHYIIIPIDSVTKQLQGRTFQLLNWMNTQPIRLFSKFEADLSSPPIEPLNEPLPTELNQEEVNKIKCYLNDTNNEGQPLLLLALAVLNNDKRLLLTDNNRIDFVESLLLLLPASVRSKVSIARGILDEEYCNWAKLLIKANNSSRGKLVDKLIRLNYGSKKFEGQFNRDTTFKSDYVTLLQAILNIPDIDIIPRLLKQLDSIEDNNVTLEDPATANIIIRLIKEFPQIFQQVWKSLSSTKQIQFLKELRDNLHLAEILLLKQKLLEQLPYETEDNEFVRESIALCQSVVADKSQKDFQKAWNLATHFVTNKIFQDNITARFELLDTSLAGEIKVEDLYNSFNCKLALLLVNFDAVKIHTSNLYSQLQTKNSRAAELLNTLLTKRNTALKHLPQLANLTGMEESEQDKFYQTVLDTWSPSYEDGRELLIALIDQTQESGSQFNGNTLVKTRAWFEGKKPEFSNIFIALQQPSITWDNWKELAKALYENQQHSAAFLDKRVGTILPAEVLETWLPIIAEDENLRREFCQNSSAWEQLRSQREHFDQFVVTRPEYATTLLRCLRDSNRLDWINSNLIHSLCDYWNQHKQVDDDLRTLVTNPDVTQKFTYHDWLKLQYVCWTIGTDLNLPPGRPDLGVKEKIELLDRAIEIANNLYTKPTQTRRLLQACKAWQLDSTQLKDILRRVNDQARDFELVLDYISIDLEAIDPTQDIPLLFTQLSRLLPKSLSQLLNDRLKQNFPLAEKLLDLGLYEQHCLLNNNEIQSELRRFCHIVVQYKSKQNWSQAWELVKKLDLSTAFKDDSDRLELLNAVRPTFTVQEKKLLQEYAMTIVKLYTQPQQMRRLLEDSSTWGLSLTEQKEILKANRFACDFDLVFQYL